MQPSETEFNPMSPTDFELLGMDHVAYVKEVSDGESPKFAVYAANGAEIAMMEADDMEPVSVH